MKEISLIVCCLVVLFFPQGVAYITVARANDVAACALPSYLLDVSPVAWLEGIGVSYLVFMGALGACILCYPFLPFVFVPVVLWMSRLWRIASVVVTGFVLFRQFNAACYGTTVWQVLLAEFILSIIGFFGLFVVKIHVVPESEFEPV